MTTPKRESIYKKALELYVQHCYRTGTPELASITPTRNELVESGYVQTARSTLMSDMNRAMVEKEYIDFPESFDVDIKEAMQTTSFVSGSRGVGKSDVCMYIVDRLTNEGIISVVFDPSTDWSQRSSISQYQTLTIPYIEKIPEQNMIFDISRLTPIQQQQCLERFCKKLFERQLENDSTKYYLVFEEAQLFFPLNSLRSRKTQYSMRVLTTGRNFNISMCAISQFPSLIDKELVKNAQQIWIGLTSELNTLKYWHVILGDDIDTLKTLQNGQFVYYHRNEIGLTEIESYKSNIVKAEIKPKNLKPIIESIKPKETCNSDKQALFSFLSMLIFTLVIIYVF
jgi:hypothetical protein